MKPAPNPEAQLSLLPVPTRAQAEIYLSEAAARNPGPWVQHSLHTAQAAQYIAAHYPGLDPQRAFILGALHDIGRRYGVSGMRHALDGYRFLAGEGFEGAARICMTHSYPLKSQPAGASPWDGSREELQFVHAYLESIQYDAYDRLIQLCDALALPNGFCLMEKRLVDVVMRYGFHKETLARWQNFFKIQEEIEAKIGGSIYRLLPGVIENTFEWKE